MKLSFKIFLGFIVTCLIFIILSAYIAIALRQVERGNAAMALDIMPTYAAANDIKYTAAIEALFIQDFTYSSNEKSWTRAREMAARMNSLTEILMADAKTEFAVNLSAQYPEMWDQIQNLEAAYKDFAETSAPLPGILLDINSAQADILVVYEKLVESAAAFTDMKLRSQLSDIDSSLSPSEIQHHSERIAALNSLENLGFTMMVKCQQAAMRRNLNYFDRAMVDCDKIIEIIAELEAASGPRGDQAQMGDIKKLALGCRDLIIRLKAAYQRSFESMAQLSVLRDEVLAQSALVEASMHRQAMQVTTEASQSVTAVLWSLIVGLLAAVAMSLVLAWAITRSITRPITKLIEALADGAQEVDQAAAQLSQSSDQLAQGASTNASSLEEVNAALEELSSMTNRNADHAIEADRLMEATITAVQAASGSMGSLTRAMEDISSQGDQISKIIKTIDEIAFQTNLLALNAAVEAARAGEAGTGFAVVADEVRNLAIRSAEAAKNTADLIAGTINSIHSGSAMVSATGENIQTVETHSTQVGHLLVEVSEASQQQSQGIGQISQAMNDMDRISQGNAASSEESAGAANQLTQQVTNLLEAITSLNKLIYGRDAQAQAGAR